MPKCHKCGTTEDLRFINPYNHNKFSCNPCASKSVKVPKLHKTRKREEWDKLAEQINGRIARKHA